MRKVQPRPPVAATSVGDEHDTSGLDGYPAHDFFAAPGTKVVAPISGKIVKLSGHDPKQGAVEGAGGPLGWSVYIQGDDGRTYYLTHMGSRTVKMGQRVVGGQGIGTVADYDKYGRPSHIHMGISGEGGSMVPSPAPTKGRTPAAPPAPTAAAPTTAYPAVVPDEGAPSVYPVMPPIVQPALAGRQVQDYHLQNPLVETWRMIAQGSASPDAQRYLSLAEAANGP